MNNYNYICILLIICSCLSANNLQNKYSIDVEKIIHSLDNEKLAIKLNKYEKELNKKVKFFIQVNLSEEKQKSGVLLDNLNHFYNFCTKKLSLNIIGLMCLPPINSDPNKNFKILKKYSEKLNLSDLSMGMSADYEHVIINGSTYLRLGTAIFGEIKNTGEKIISIAEMNVEFMNEDGEVAKVHKFFPVNKFSFTESLPLKPGKSKEFGFPIDDLVPEDWDGTFKAKLTELIFK